MQCDVTLGLILHTMKQLGDVVPEGTITIFISMESKSVSSDFRVRKPIGILNIPTS